MEQGSPTEPDMLLQRRSADTRSRFTLTIPSPLRSSMALMGVAPAFVPAAFTALHILQGDTVNPNSMLMSPACTYILLTHVHNAGQL